MKYIENQLKAKIVKLQDKNNNFTSDNVEDALNEAGDKIKNKQDKLVSGTNIKTINGTSILGSGNITITGEGGSIDTSSFATKTEVNTNLSKKQDKLVSGTNIKTINGQSLLGYGNIEITSFGGSGTNFSVSYNEVNEELTITTTTENNIIYNESTESLTIGGAD